MLHFSKKKIFSSEIIIYFNNSNFSDFFFQRGFLKIPKTVQKISINKSPHIFKKSKERFFIKSPIKIHIITPFFSNSFLLKIFLKFYISYFFFSFFSTQIKVINRITYT